jgi:hypothetical protein
MSIKKITSILFSLILLSSSLITSIPVSAQETGVRSVDGVAVQPAESERDPNQSITRAWFVKSMKAGETVESKALISNLSDKEKVILLSPEDRVPNSDQFSFTDKEPLKDVGTWITLDRDQFTVPAQRSLEVTFKIKVPENTPAGEYAGVLAVQELKPVTGTSGFNVINRVGSRVYITVAGDLKTGTEIPKFEFNSPASPDFANFVRTNFNQKFDAVNMNLTVNITGNIFQKVKGDIIIETPSGTITETFNRDFVPKDLPVRIPALTTKAKWQVGKYKATFNLESLPLIIYNKSDVKDFSSTKTYTTEVNITQADLDKMKKDFEDTNAKRPKSNDPVTKPTDSNKNEGGGITITESGIKKDEVKNDNNSLFIGLGIGAGVIIIGLIAVVAYLVWKQRKDAKDSTVEPTIVAEEMPTTTDTGVPTTQKTKKPSKK